MSTMLEVTLVRTPGVCGGNLRIDGTGLSVNQIVTLHNQGLSAEQIVEQYPHRTLREIYAVLAWYYEHKTEFDEELAAEAREAEAIIRQFQTDDRS
jgi:uncharacterized protein (DUF433 family)